MMKYAYMDFTFGKNMGLVVSKFDVVYYVTMVD